VIVSLALVTIPVSIVTYGVKELSWIKVVGGTALFIIGATCIHVIDQKRSTRLALAKPCAKLKVPASADLRTSVLTAGWVLRSRLSDTAHFPDTAKRDIRMSIHQGVEGRCFRSNRTVKIQLNDEGRTDRLVRDFGLTHAQAERYRRGRAAVVCLPIQNAKKAVIGVLSLDANADVFTPQLITQVQGELVSFYEALEIF
jgi:hypothetical protein